MESSRSLHTFTVDFPGPLDIPASFEMFRRWGDDRLNRWDGETLVSTIQRHDRVIPYAVVNIGTVLNPAVEVMVGQAEDASEVESAVQHMFIAAPEALETLIAMDSVIARHRGSRSGRDQSLRAMSASPGFST